MEKKKAAAARAQPGRPAEAGRSASPEKTRPEGRAERGRAVVWLSPPNRRRPPARPTHAPASVRKGRHRQRGGARWGSRLLQRRAATKGSRFAKGSLEPIATMLVPQCWAGLPARAWRPTAESCRTGTRPSGLPRTPPRMKVPPRSSSSCPSRYLSFDCLVLRIGEILTQFAGFELQ